MGLSVFRYSGAAPSPLLMCVGCFGKQNRFFPRWMPQMHSPHPRGSGVSRDRLCVWADCQGLSSLSVASVVGILVLRPFFSLHLVQIFAAVLAILVKVVSPAPVPVHVRRRPCQPACILPCRDGIVPAQRRVQGIAPLFLLEHGWARGQNVPVCWVFLLVLVLVGLSYATCVVYFSTVVLLGVAGFAFLASPRAQI